MESSNAIDMLSGLAQDTRLGIFRELVRHHEPQGGGLAAGALAESLGIAPPTLSFHLKEMTRAGLLASRKDGRSVIYRANLEAMNDLVCYLLEDCCGGRCDVSIQTRSCP